MYRVTVGAAPLLTPITTQADVPKYLHRLHPEARRPAGSVWKWCFWTRMCLSLQARIPLMLLWSLLLTESWTYVRVPCSPCMCAVVITVKFSGVFLFLFCVTQGCENLLIMFFFPSNVLPNADMSNLIGVLFVLNITSVIPIGCCI